MEIRTLGKSGLKVPVIGMGTWQTFDVCEKSAEDNCRVVVDQALASGANFFDSSVMYGESERVLGATLQGRRKSALIATKVWTASTSEGRAQIDRALKFFGGHIELYQIHNLLNWEEHLETLEELKQAGKIDAIGATHHKHASFPDLMAVMKTGRISTIQIPYNPVECESEREVLPLAAELGLGVIVMRPFWQGRLARQKRSAEELEPLKKFGVRTWAQALLKWSMSDPRCHVAIPATSSPERMKEDAAAGEPPWFGPEERAYVAKLATSEPS